MLVLRLYSISGLLVGILFSLSACSFSPRQQDSAPRAEINVAAIPNAVPRIEERTSAGNPPNYSVNGRTYYVKQSSQNHVERGIASWYGTKFHGRTTANGETYSMYQMTAAHKTLPIPTYVEVKNLENGRTVIVRINDRGPFHNNRIIDLSYVAAKKLGITAKGTGLVEIRSIDPRQWRSGTRESRQFLTTTTHKPGNTTQTNELFIQAGAFASRFNAQQLQKQLNVLLPESVITLAFAEGDKLYRVRIGPLNTVSEADRVARKISENGYPDPQVIID